MIFRWLLPLALLSSPAIADVKAEAPSFVRLVPKAAKVRVLAEGFTWSEGPVWISEGGYLLFSDVPKNRIYRWAPGDRAASVFLEPSGAADPTGFREPGSNGLKPAGRGRILVADHGNRGVALLDLVTKKKQFLAQRFDGKRLNSPNDVAVGPDGSIWFTDPPYGLEGINDSPLKEQSANRVYRLALNGKVAAVVSDLTFPNGIAFSPDGRTLYVANSDPKKAIIVAWDVSGDGELSNRRLVSDMTELAANGVPGLPDGMAVDERGNLWATGPGGVHVFNPQGKEIGLISTGAKVSNCAFGGPDGRTLFMTSTDKLVVIRTNVRGAAVRLPKIAEVVK
jgi:gluconolactonase